MKNLIDTLLREALVALPDTLVPAAARDVLIEVERAREAQHGDFASNIAMRLAKATRQNPRKLAEAIKAALPASPAIAKVEIAGAGFINFFLNENAYHAEIGRVLAQDADYGRSQFGKGGSVLVEFVSANPTGPLHVGHGRHAAFGASLANLLEAVGYRVAREYYVNDAGRQMEILAASTWLRYLERCGERFQFPANGYRGDYITAIADELHAAQGAALRRSAIEIFKDLPADEPQGGDKDEYIDALIMRARLLLGDAAFRRVLDQALGGILADIREDLAEFGVTFDSWFSERSLIDSGAIDRAVAALQAAGLAYLKDGALWFKSTEYGDEKDRVIVRENGIKTYFASDIAFVFNKRQRGFEHLLYVWGADHHGYITRLRAGLIALGGPPECFEVRLVQFVSLFRGGEKVQMSTRSGEFVTLRELRSGGGQRCGAPVLRDAQQRSASGLRPRAREVPLQRQPGVLHSVCACARREREAADAGARTRPRCHARAGRRLSSLIEPQELQLIKRVSAFPEVVQQCAVQRAPHSLVHYLRDLANDFHTYYSAHQFLVEDAALRDARVALALAAQVVIRNGLRLLGVSAPDTM